MAKYYRFAAPIDAADGDNGVLLYFCGLMFISDDGKIITALKSYTGYPII